MEQWNLCSSKATEQKLKYNILSRSSRLRVTFQESADYTSSSQREESFQSTSSWKYNDTISGISRPDKFFKVSNDRGTSLRQSIEPKLNDNVKCIENEYDSIVKVDEFELPSKDASLNVVYTKQGDIQIRLHRKTKKNKKCKKIVKFWNFFTNALKSRPSPAHIGFYTPPIDDDFSLSNFKLTEKVSEINQNSKNSDDISNSSLRDIDHDALRNELSEYKERCQHRCRI